MVTEQAISRMKERLDGGDTPRQDGFFDRDFTGRSPAEEVFEGVFLRAKNESEEKKSPFLANLVASVAFDSAISVEMANYFIKLAEKLTYRQYCLVALVGIVVNLNVEQLRRAVHDDIELEVLRREEMDMHLSDLGTFGLLYGSGPWDDSLSPLGHALYLHMELNKVPLPDVEKVVGLLHKAGCSVNLPTYLSSVSLQGARV